MGKINNDSPEQDYNTSVGFPEVRKRYRYDSADFMKIWDYLGSLLYMLVDSFNGKYPFPKKTAIALIFSFFYFINPVDIVLDILPLIGFVDDIAVLAFAASFIKDDLEKYRLWKMSIVQ
jgi:uncharacterized membrane protein YkvA (DUF1232 family)